MNEYRLAKCPHCGEDLAVENDPMRRRADGTMHRPDCTYPDRPCNCYSPSRDTEIERIAAVLRRIYIERDLFGGNLDRIDRAVEQDVPDLLRSQPASEPSLLSDMDAVDAMKKALGYYEAEAVHALAGLGEQGIRLARSTSQSDKQPASEPSLDVAALEAAIDAVVNAPDSGVWIDYSGKAKARRGGIRAARRKFARAILARLSQPADNEAAE